MMTTMRRGYQYNAMSRKPGSDYSLAKKSWVDSIAVVALASRCKGQRWAQMKLTEGMQPANSAGPLFDRLTKRLDQIHAIQNEFQHPQPIRKAKMNFKNILRLQGELQSMGVIPTPTKWQILKRPGSGNAQSGQRQAILMSIKYDPAKMLRKLAPPKKVERLLSGRVTLKKTALSFLDDADFIDKKQVTDAALKTIQGLPGKNCKGSG